MQVHGEKRVWESHNFALGGTGLRRAFNFVSLQGPTRWAPDQNWSNFAKTYPEPPTQCRAPAEGEATCALTDLLRSFCTTSIR